MSAELPAGAPPSRAAPRRAGPGDGAGNAADGRIEAIALVGIPEIVAGDDLATLIGDALEATAGVLPLRGDDVLVVTQKVISKAEGALVRLSDIEPSPLALQLASQTHGKDPRAVEVVLRQTKRIVRNDRGQIGRAHV